MGIESVLVKIILVFAFIIGGILIIPTKRKRIYLLRGEELTLKQIAEKFCVNGVLVCEMDDTMQMEYDHDPEAIPEVLQNLLEAEIPAEVFNETSVLVRCPIVYRHLDTV